MDLKKIHHVAIIVSDYEVSRRFYVELLGFKSDPGKLQAGKR